jgi:hypothetical protein
MTISIRHAATWMFVAVAASAVPAFAQSTAPVAAPTNGNAANAPAPVNRTVRDRNSEQQLLGAPREYGNDGIQGGNGDDPQRTALLDEQRMTVTDGGQAARPAAARGQRKAPAGANGTNGPVRVAGQPGRPNAADGLTPQGATRAAYADPYGAGKRTVYRSPW